MANPKIPTLELDPMPSSKAGSEAPRIDTPLPSPHTLATRTSLHIDPIMKLLDGDGSSTGSLKEPKERFRVRRQQSKLDREQAMRNNVRRVMSTFAGLLDDEEDTGPTQPTPSGGTPISNQRANDRKLVHDDTDDSLSGEDVAEQNVDEDDFADEFDENKTRCFLAAEEVNDDIQRLMDFVGKMRQMSPPSDAAGGDSLHGSQIGASPARTSKITTTMSNSVRRKSATSPRLKDGEIDNSQPLFSLFLGGSQSKQEYGSPASSTSNYAIGSQAMNGHHPSSTGGATKPMMHFQSFLELEDPVGVEAIAGASESGMDFSVTNLKCRATNAVQPDVLSECGSHHGNQATGNTTTGPCSGASTPQSKSLATPPIGAHKHATDHGCNKAAEALLHLRAQTQLIVSECQRYMEAYHLEKMRHKNCNDQLARVQRQLDDSIVKGMNSGGRVQVLLRSLQEKRDTDFQKILVSTCQDVVAERTRATRAEGEAGKLKDKLRQQDLDIKQCHNEIERLQHREEQLLEHTARLTEALEAKGLPVPDPPTDLSESPLLFAHSPLEMERSSGGTTPDAASPSGVDRRLISPSSNSLRSPADTKLLSEL